MTSDLRLAFTIPWFGPGIPGGAEMLCREWTAALDRAGWDVRVLTTTIRELASDWNQPHYPAGTSRIDGVEIQRFPSSRGNHTTFNRINEKLLQGFPVTRCEEEAFYREGPNSDEMMRFISSNRERYWFVFLPYPFGTSYFGMRAAGHKALLLPCLHDEAYARMACMRRRIEGVQGLVFNSAPEQRLALKLYGIRSIPQIVLGMGLDGNISGEAARFRTKYGIDRPFLLYVGRKDSTKGTDTLVDYYRRFRARNPKRPLELVLAGPGAVRERLPGVHDVGFLPTADKYDALAAADLFCQPSVNESFSIVLMEAWLCGTPVLVNHACPVTRDFALRGRGGVGFGDYFEFEAAVEYLEDRSELRQALARSGAEFVRRSFAWPPLIQRFEEWLGGLADGRRTDS
ncbi:MAG: glycosyltransferase family 4 protein [Acidobacteriota bacterium]